MSNQDDLEALKTGVETAPNTNETSKTQENFVPNSASECDLNPPSHQKKRKIKAESPIIAFTIFMPFNVLILEYFVKFHFFSFTNKSFYIFSPVANRTNS